MGRIALCGGVNFGAPQFFYEQTTPTLQPDIDRRSNSLALYVQNFKRTAFFERPNFGGDAIVITNPGSVADLSKSPWGNWANRIASIFVGFNLEAFLEREGRDESRRLYISGELPSPVEELSILPDNVVRADADSKETVTSALLLPCTSLFAAGIGRVGIRNNCAQCKFAVIVWDGTKVKRYRVEGNNQIIIDIEGLNGQLIGEDPC